MINFFEYYNKTELDHEHYAPYLQLFFASPLSPGDQLDALVRELKQIEHIIKKSPQFAYFYSRHIIKRRFIDAEQYIRKHDYWWAQYVVLIYD